MSTEATGSQARGTRWRWLRLAGGLLLAGWLGHFAYVRWTTPPAAGAVETAESAAAAKTSAALISALGSFPTYRPTGGRTQPRPWYPAGELELALLGPWTPSSRSELAAIIPHVSSTRVETALDEIIERCDQLRQAHQNLADISQTMRWQLGMGAQTVRATLAARARVRHAEQQDPTAALADLRASLALHDVLHGAEISSFYGEQVWQLDIFEMIILAQECDLPPEPAAQMIAFLRDELSLSLSQALATATLASDVQSLLARHYTDDGRGNGWLVLSTLQVNEFLFGDTATQRSRAWNVFAPLFNDRQTVAARMAGFHGSFTDADGLDFKQARDMVLSQQRAQPRTTIMDGPFSERRGSLAPLDFNFVFSDVMWRRAAVVILALSAYKHDHGPYPDDLAALSPRYLREIPTDLLTAKPFEYQLKPDGTYELRTAGRFDPALNLRKSSDYDMSVHMVADDSLYSLSRPEAPR